MTSYNIEDVALFYYCHLDASGNTRIHQLWTLLNYFLKNKLPKNSMPLDSTFPMKTFLPAKLDRETLL